MRPATLAIAFGAGRVLFGVALLAAPAPIARGWVGADDTPAPVLARWLGGARHRDRRRPRHRGGARPRSAPVAGGRRPGRHRRRHRHLAAGGDIPRNGRLGTAALAGGSALFGAWLARAID